MAGAHLDLSSNARVGKDLLEGMTVGGGCLGQQNLVLVGHDGPAQVRPAY